MRLVDQGREREDATVRFIKPACGPCDALKEPKGRRGSICCKVVEITISSIFRPLKTCRADVFRELC